MTSFRISRRSTRTLTQAAATALLMSTLLAGCGGEDADDPESELASACGSLVDGDGDDPGSLDVVHDALNNTADDTQVAAAGPAADELRRVAPTVPDELADPLLQLAEAAEFRVSAQELGQSATIDDAQVDATYQVAVDFCEGADEE